MSPDSRGALQRCGVLFHECKIIDVDAGVWTNLPLF